MKIGIDIVDLKKFKDNISSGGNTMMEKIFTKEEMYFAKEVNKLAGIFAAKEAFIKASPNNKYKMNEIEIVKDKNGKPILKEPANVVEDGEVELSIAHDGNYVVAICVMKKNF